MNLRFKLEEKKMVRKFYFQFKISAHPSGEEISSKQCMVMHLERER